MSEVKLRKGEPVERAIPPSEKENWTAKPTLQQLSNASDV
jgi:hypothetical protein